MIYSDTYAVLALAAANTSRSGHKADPERPPVGAKTGLVRRSKKLIR